MSFLNKNLFLMLSAMGILLGISEAWKLRWLCDDAFISYTYARNLSEGLGLVYQSGEVVEGFSNFLWTMLLSGFFLLHVSPMLVSQLLGMLFYFLLCLSFYYHERKLRPFAGVPLFILHLVLFYHGWIFATSGLETMMFTYFLTMGLLHWHTNRSKAGWFLLLSALTRPEGALFLVLHALSRWREYKNFKVYLPLMAFLFFIGFRYFYFGHLVPNTFYAKANGPANFSQGILYLFYFMRVYPLYVPVFILSIFFLVQSGFRTRNESILSSALIVYLFYVIYIGGDFMAMRFWLPVIPFLSWTVYHKFALKMEELQISSNLTTKWNSFLNKNLIIVQLLFLLSLGVYLDPFKNESKQTSLKYNVGEERRFYANTLASGLGYDMDAFKDFRVVFFGAQAHFIYFMRPLFAWEGEAGLTDPNRAYATASNVPGRVGHENYATVQGLLDRKIDLVLANRFPELNLPSINYQFRDFQWEIFILRYNPQKFNYLCARNGFDCHALYEEIAKRNLDKNKAQQFWYD